MDPWMKVLIMFIKCAAVVGAAVLLGNGAVYFFNKMPARWFVDYGEEPDPDSSLMDPYTQRIKSHPWKTVFTMLFVILGLWMGADDIGYAAAACLSIWLLIEMAIGDALYRIIPDQLIILLGVTALGYIPYATDWRHYVYGAGIGLGIMLLIALLGRLVYRQDTLGGGDIKLFAVLGLIAGPFGILEIFAMSTVLSVIHYLYLLGNHKVKKGDRMPMAPYIAPAAMIFLAFLWGRAEVIWEL